MTYHSKLGIPIELTQNGDTWQASNEELQVEGYPAKTPTRAISSFDSAVEDWLQKQKDPEYPDPKDVNSATLLRRKPPPPLFPDWVQKQVDLRRKQQVELTWQWPERPDAKARAIVAGPGEEVDRLVADLNRAGIRAKASPWKEVGVYTVESIREAYFEDRIEASEDRPEP